MARAKTVHCRHMLALARGWSSWLSKHEERMRLLQLVRGAANRMSRPKLTASFVHWRDDWSIALRAALIGRRRTQIEHIRDDYEAQLQRHRARDGVAGAARDAPSGEGRERVARTAGGARR